MDRLLRFCDFWLDISIPIFNNLGVLGRGDGKMPILNMECADGGRRQDSPDLVATTVDFGGHKMKRIHFLVSRQYYCRGARSGQVEWYLSPPLFIQLLRDK